MVAALVRCGARDDGFREFLRELHVMTPLRPDAWKADRQRRHVDIYEVIVANDINRAKAAWYRTLRRNLWRVGWRVRILAMDRRGRVAEFNP
jgi:hypothetical protein